MTHRRHGAAIALLLAMCLALPAAPLLAGDGQVTGTVKDSTGAVLIGASVTLRNSAGATVQTGSTDARGRYQLAGIPAGTYTLFVYRDGFAPATEEVKVEATGAEKDVSLSPASFSEEVTVSFTGESARTALKFTVSPPSSGMDFPSNRLAPGITSRRHDPD